MIDIKSILPNYFSILEKNKMVDYLISKKIPVLFDKSESTKKLWEKHDSLLENKNILDYSPTQSLLDLKIELANRIFKNCTFCEKRCHVNRNINSGKCRVKNAKITSEFLHIGEERVLIPSYTIFFSGCTFNCVFCQNYDISQQICGLEIKPENLVYLIEKRIIEGAKNVNWVGGDPTSNLLYILNVLKNCNENIPQIWNSNMYCSKETMKLLNGIIDVYLTDFKYGNNDCAKRLSKIDNYFDIVKRNHNIAYTQGDVIIRHLIIPNHIICCSEMILKWISKNIPDVAVNLMAQYRPEYKAYDYEDISKPLSVDDYYKMKNRAVEYNINLI